MRVTSATTLTPPARRCRMSPVGGSLLAEISLLVTARTLVREPSGAQTGRRFV